MDELSLEANTLAEFHTGLAQRFDGLSMPDMGMSFTSKVNNIEENLTVTATRLNFQ